MSTPQPQPPDRKSPEPEPPESGPLESGPLEPNSAEPQKKDAHSLAVSGTLWTVVGYGGSMALRFGSNVLLAHLLFPAAFGVMALVNVFMLGLEMFSDLGIWRGVVQHKKGDQAEFLDTAFTIQVLRGVLLWIVTCAVAWPYASFYGNPMLMWYLMVGGLLVVFRGFESSSLLLLRRRVELKQIALFNLCGQIIQVLTMVLFAWIYPSVWALVAGGITGSLYKMAASHLCIRVHKPRFRWDPTAAHALLHFGKWMFFSSIVTFLASSSDRLILGKVVSEDELGVYSIAFGYTSMAVVVAGRLANTVLFPIISRFQEDPGQVMGMFLSARRVLLSAAGGLCAAIVMGAPVFFDWFFADEYQMAGVYSQWLALLTWAGILVLGIDLVPLSLGNSRVQFFGNLIRSVGISTAVFGFFLAGIPGLVCGLTVAALVAFLFLVTRLPEGRWSVIAQSFRHTIVWGAYTAIGITAVSMSKAQWGMNAAHITGLTCSLLALGYAGLATLRSVRRPATPEVAHA